MKESKNLLFKEVTLMGEAITNWQMHEALVVVVNVSFRYVGYLACRLRISDQSV